MAKTWLITGCSTGFGRFLAEAVLAAGDNVLLTARQPDVLADLAAQYPKTARTQRLDVTKQADIDAAVKAANDAFGGVDVLINNAGFSVVGAIEELTPEEYRPLYETNLFGVIEMMRAVMPQMRKRGSGVIGNVSSVGGQVPSPGMSHYSATKSGMEMITEAMATELKQYGVRMLIIEPGLFRTAIIGSLRYPKNVMPEYDGASGEVRRRMEAAVGNEPGDPRKAALAIIGAVNNPNAGLRLPIGVGAVDRMKARLDAVAANLEACREIAENTSFDKA